MNSLALSFNEVKFNPVVQSDGQIYLTASELAQALDYKSVKSVSNLYNSNKDEFTASMSLVIESMTNGINNSKRKLNVRIFSLRGCHLIAFFARTSVAKAFRKWVLDVLDREVGAPIAKTHKSERTALHEAHALLVTKTKHLNVSEAWKMIRQRFNANHIDEIPYDQIPVAVEYVHHLIALYSNADKQNSQPNINLVRELVEDILMQNFMLQNVWKGLYTLDKKLYLNAMRYVVDSNVSALNVIKSFNLKTKQGKDMISADFRVINFHSGMAITGCNPNYFNAPS